MVLFRRPRRGPAELPQAIHAQARLLCAAVGGTSGGRDVTFQFLWRFTGRGGTVSFRFVEGVPKSGCLRLERIDHAADDTSSLRSGNDPRFFRRGG